MQTVLLWKETLNIARLYSSILFQAFHLQHFLDLIIILPLHHRSKVSIAVAEVVSIVHAERAEVMMWHSSASTAD